MQNCEKDRKNGACLEREVLKKCRADLYGRYPFLDTALAGLGFQASERTKRIGTDGDTVYYDPRFLLRCYAEDPAELRRGYLHMLLHCLFFHTVRETHYEKRRWDLACDVAVELTAGNRDGRIRKICLEKLEGKAISAERIYTLLEADAFPVPQEEMESAFTFDDHRFWEENRGSAGSRIRKKWEKIREHTGEPGTLGAKRAGTEPGDAQEEWEALRKSRCDYRRFLKRFARLREEAKLDMENFDPIWYSYGMEQYGDLALIEPLEYKEGNRLEELAIAIDTSGSCSVRMVSDFLGETREILSEKENFFSRMQVYLIQCDCCIQDVTVIHSVREWEEYRSRLKIKGRAGTDFRPVFRYIEQEREKKKLRNLRALLYFTDGDGIYPDRKPEYETAFVFTEKTPWMDRAPGWALRLLAGKGNGKRDGREDVG